MLALFACAVAFRVRARAVDGRAPGREKTLATVGIPSRGIAVLTLTATRELHLEPLEVRGNLEGGVRTLLSLPFSHVVERCYALGAREKGMQCARSRRFCWVSATGIRSRVWRLMT